MTNGKGRHASEGSSGFYRDLAVMVVGIIVVGAAVFGLLVWLADNPEASTAPTTTSSTTSTTEPSTTTIETTTSSTSTSSTSTTTTSTTVPVRAPEEVRVVVLNSIGLDGAAGRMTQRLEEAGYQILPADDFSPEQDPSHLWFREGFSAEANEMVSFIPGASVEPLPDETLEPGADVIMVLGIGYEE